MSDPTLAKKILVLLLAFVMLVGMARPAGAASFVYHCEHWHNNHGVHSYAHAQSGVAYGALIVTAETGAGPGGCNNTRNGWTVEARIILDRWENGRWEPIGSQTRRSSTGFTGAVVVVAPLVGHYRVIRAHGVMDRGTSRTSWPSVQRFTIPRPPLLSDQFPITSTT